MFREQDMPVCDDDFAAAFHSAKCTVAALVHMLCANKSNFWLETREPFGLSCALEKGAIAQVWRSMRTAFQFESHV